MHLPPVPQRGRLLQLAAVAILSAAVLGFFAGTREAAPPPHGYGQQGRVASDVRSARSYTELRERAEHLNSEIYTWSAEALQRGLPGLADPITRLPGNRTEALERRASRRAFDGAPPTIPHPTDERAAPNCGVCHDTGAKIGELVAPAMSHLPLENCRQCHTSATPPGFVERPSTPPNDFVPLPFGGLGSRAMPGAPPALPHTTWMRDNCDSCHGVAGALGLRTTHPDRQNCRQCHAASAVYDQRAPVLTLAGARPAAE